MLQDKIKQTHEQHNKAISEERKRATKEAESTNEQLLKELTESKNEIKLLKETIEAIQTGTVPAQMINGLHHQPADSGSTPEIQISEVSPPKSKKASKQRKDHLMPSADSIRTHRGSIGSIPADVKGSPLLRSHRHKTQAQETLDILGIDSTAKPTTKGKVEMVTNRSFDSAYAAQEKKVGDKLTITQLVEDSLHKPGSMAAIRMQIKADGLTPRINRKFKRELPSMPEEIALDQIKDQST